MITVGRVISASTMPPTSGAERGRPSTFRNNASPSRPNTIDGNGGEVVDVDLDPVGPAVFGRELLEMQGGRGADREGQAEGHDQRPEGADHGAPDSRQLGLAAVAGAEEARREVPLDAAFGAQRLEPADLLPPTGPTPSPAPFS